MVLGRNFPYSSAQRRMCTDLSNLGFRLQATKRLLGKEPADFPLF